MKASYEKLDFGVWLGLGSLGGLGLGLGLWGVRRGGGVGEMVRWGLGLLGFVCGGGKGGGGSGFIYREGDTHKVVNQLYTKLQSQSLLQRTDAPSVVLAEARAGDAAKGERPAGKVHQLWGVFGLGWFVLGGAWWAGVCVSMEGGGGIGIDNHRRTGTVVRSVFYLRAYRVVEADPAGGDGVGHLVAHPPVSCVGGSCRLVILVQKRPPCIRPIHFIPPTFHA